MNQITIFSGGGGIQLDGVQKQNKTWNPIWRYDETLLEFVNLPCSPKMCYNLINSLVLMDSEQFA